MFHSSPVHTNLIWPVLFMGIVLSGCSHTSELFREIPIHETVNIDYSVIYYIHADSDYLYHDAVGKPVKENIKVLDEALDVAKKAESGEVFIFYQRPERKFPGLFHRRNSRLYHYVNGELTSRVNFRHSEKSEEFLTTEARLFDQYRIKSREENKRSYFLFFGHEIPVTYGEKYHRTLPNIAVNAGSFSAGIQKFLATDDQRFDLVVLSTCNNGTPVFAGQLISFSDILLASPQNLHLSHIDTERLGLLESEPGISSIQVAHSMAEQTYRRLDSEIQTAITLTVYDFEVVQNFKNELYSFSMAYDTLGRKLHISDNVDCKEVSIFKEEIFRKGLKTWYKPARFGRNKIISTHSGWGCKPLIENEQDVQTRHGS